jgi:LAGLIDADG DNA endonuclease family
MKSAKFLECLRQSNKKRAHLILTEDVMQQMCDYHAQGYTKGDMCIAFGVGRAVIDRCFKEMGLQGRIRARSILSPRCIQGENSALLRAQQLEPLIRDCFLNKDMSAVDVGRLCHLNYGTIIRYARLLDIPVQTRSQAASKRRGHLSITEDLLQILDGELLGDGCIPKSHTASAQFCYATPRSLYLEWLAKLLERHGLPGRISGPFAKSVGQPCYQYTSKWYPELADLRQRWYPHGTKIVPHDLILTPTVCRHWYIGDGSIKQPPHHPYIVMCTHGFTHEDVEFLVSLLEPIAPGARVGKPVHAGPPLWLGKKAALAFLEYIGECPEPIREVYGYKWRLPATDLRAVLH